MVSGRATGVLTPSSQHTATQEAYVSVWTSGRHALSKQTPSPTYLYTFTRIGSRLVLFGVQPRSRHTDRTERLISQPVRPLRDSEPAHTHAAPVPEKKRRSWPQPQHLRGGCVPSSSAMSSSYSMKLSPCGRSCHPSLALQCHPSTPSTCALRTARGQLTRCCLPALRRASFRRAATC